MNHFLEALPLALGMGPLIGLLLGTLIGLVIGIIPGIGPAQSIPISIPFTLGMAPTTAISFLIGQYVGGFYGGSITAILIKVPGTPANIATVFDGYPLAQRGYAGKAMRMALYSSVIGDLFAVALLILAAEPLARLALSFGPAEIAAVALLSMTLIISVSGDSLLLGAFSMIVGAFVSFVGMDSITGTPRLTFGLLELQLGVGLVPLVIGLYGLTEMLSEVMYPSLREASSTPRISQAADQRVTFSELWRVRHAIARGTVVGTVIGVLPGLGSSVASLLGYSWARQGSKTPEEFGNGSLEGIAAPEAANNAETSGALLPFLSLGIPGSAIVAMLGGAFLLHGLQPGPKLFVEKTTEVLAIFIVLVISKFALLVLGLGAIAVGERIVDTPRWVIIPAVLVLCVGGTFALSADIFDVIVMISFGFVGIAFMHLRIPREPLLIAFLLAPMFEHSFRQALLITGGDFAAVVARPIVFLSILLSVAAVVWQVWRRWRRRSTQIIRNPSMG